MDDPRPPGPDADRFEGYPRPIDGADEAALAPFAAKHFHAAPQPHGQSLGFNLVAGFIGVPVLLVLMVTAPPAALLLVPAALIVAFILRPKQVSRREARRNFNRNLVGAKAPACEQAEPLRGAMLVPGRVILASQTRAANGDLAVDLTVRYYLGGEFREARNEMPYDGPVDRFNMQLVPVLLLRDAMPFVLAEYAGRPDIRD